MNDVKAIIDGVDVIVPYSLFKDIVDIPRSTYKEEWWQNNCGDCPSLDIFMNRFSFVVNNAHPIADVMQIDSNNVVHVCVNRETFSQLKQLKKRAKCPKK